MTIAYPIAHRTNPSWTEAGVLGAGPGRDVGSIARSAFDYDGVSNGSFHALVSRLEVAGILRGGYFVVLDVPRGGERCR